MMKRTLRDQERDQREAAFHTTRARRLRARCQALLMAARGRRQRHLADDGGISVRTIQRGLPA